ncbi:MAG: hypothetical protein R3C44_13805 [Chloroflexota bacterium]
MRLIDRPYRLMANQSLSAQAPFAGVVVGISRTVLLFLVFANCRLC